MKKISINGNDYVRRWGRWYLLQDVVALEVEFAKINAPKPQADGDNNE